MRIVGYIILLIVLSVVSLFVGVSDLKVMDIFQLDARQWDLLTVSRIPRTVSLIIAGIGLSVSGHIMQQITQNKFVSPTTAGTLDAAKLGLLLSILLIPTAGLIVKSVFAFIITFSASLLFFAIADKVRYRNIIFIPLVGIIFGSILNSVSAFFAFKFKIVQNVNAWMIGDFSGVLEGNYEIIYISIPALILTYLYANKFTVAGMGESFSRNLGLNYRTVVNIGLFCVSLSVSAVVLTVGTIPFLGLIIPNMVSMMYGDNLRKTLPITALSGAVFLVICDIIGRTVYYPYEIPIGMVVGVIGGLIFLVLLMKRKK